MRTIRALSLGAGVQSTALLLMAAEGLIEKPDIAVFADTGWEPKRVYDALERLRVEVAEPNGIEVIVARSTLATGEGIRADAVADTTRFFRIPVFMRFTEDAEQYAPNARPMILRRSCTQSYKLEPIHREYRRYAGAAVSKTGRVGSIPEGVQFVQQIGISTDEFQRARTSPVSWIENSYPLLDLGWSRTVCEMYLADRGFGDVGKSSCIGCPFHSKAEWARMKREEPEAFADAVAFDREIRNGPKRERTDGTRWPATFYVHSSGKPLEEAVKDTGPEAVQTSIFDQISAESEWSCSPHGCQTEEAQFKAGLVAAGAVIVDEDGEMVPGE